jgi:beta-glucosidase
MADLEELMGALTLAEKAALTAGADMLSTVAVERVGLPRIRVTDGPSGARGESFPGAGGDPATCIPSGSAIGATWNPALAERLAALVGREARDRGFRGLLAPTVNLHRSPLAGRNFECYSEDPLLSGQLAAAYVRGVQSTGVFATVKHFVGNDAEFERSSINSLIDERSLRELYLLPFEIAVREGGALAIMTAYNRLNGRWLTQQPEYLQTILRGEWGFDGLVMTDWFGVTDMAASLAAGLDLEMPGPGRNLGDAVLAAVEDGRVEKDDLDAAIRHQLSVYNRLGALDEPRPAARPLPPTADDLALLREAAAEATVLLTNNGVLPLSPASLRRVAVIGPHAVAPCLGGGGSSQVVLHPYATPLDALSAVLGEQTEIQYERGAEADMSATVLGRSVMAALDGFELEVFAGHDIRGEVLKQQHLEELRFFVVSMMSQEWPDGDWSLRARGTVVPQESGTYQLALAQSGRTRVLLDGVTVLDGFTNIPAAGGRDFFGMASQDLLTEVTLTAGVPVEVIVEHVNAESGLDGFRVGFRTIDADGLIARAADAARNSDVALVFVGTTAEWETEGLDRTSFDLPGRQPDLISAVAAANPRTVVVVNAGAPVDMSWADDAAGVLQCWFGGQELAGGVADVLVGRSDPGGRLPTTVPMRLEHNPAHGNFPGENGAVRYAEGLFMGYRGHEYRAIAPRFPFGHGTSYTTFEMGEATLSSASFRAGHEMTVRIPVTNSGDRSGTQVVQLYVAPPPARLTRPLKELKGFCKVTLAPGETTVAEISLDERSFSYWDPGQPDAEWVAGHNIFTFPPPPATDGDAATRETPGWQLESGAYDLLLGWSSADIQAQITIEVQTG